MSEVQSAIQRALRATASLSPRKTRMKATPASGRKVTRERRGQFSMKARSGDLPQEIPGDEGDDADQHDEGVVVEIAGLQPCGPNGDLDRGSRQPVGPEPIDDGAVALLPEIESQRHCRAHEEQIVELVEIPLVEEEEIERAEPLGGDRGKARVPDISDPRHGNAEKRDEK